MLSDLLLSCTISEPLSGIVGNTRRGAFTVREPGPEYRAEILRAVHTCLDI